MNDCEEQMGVLGSDEDQKSVSQGFTPKVLLCQKSQIVECRVSIYGTSKGPKYLYSRM